MVEEEEGGGNENEAVDEADDNNLDDFFILPLLPSDLCWLDRRRIKREGLGTRNDLFFGRYGW